MERQVLLVYVGVLHGLRAVVARPDRLPVESALRCYFDRATRACRRATGARPGSEPGPPCPHPSCSAPASARHGSRAHRAKLDGASSTRRTGFPAPRGPGTRGQPHGPCPDRQRPPSRHAGGQWLPLSMPGRRGTTDTALRPGRHQPATSRGQGQTLRLSRRAASFDPVAGPAPTTWRSLRSHRIRGSRSPVERSTWRTHRAGVGRS